MTLERVNGNQRFSVRASTWNAFIDAAKAEKVRSHQPVRNIIPSPAASNLCVLVKNQTGTDLEAGNAVKLGDPVVFPTGNVNTWRDKINFECEEPDSDTSGGAVLAEPLEDGKIGKAFIAGVVACQISVTNEFLKWCDLDDGSYRLHTKPEGSHEILYKQSGTGLKYAYVRLGIPRDVEVAGKADSDITTGSTGTVSMWENGSDTLYNITAHLDWMHGSEQVSSGKEVIVKWFAHERRWRIVGAECE